MRSRPTRVPVSTPGEAARWALLFVAILAAAVATLWMGGSEPVIATVCTAVAFGVGALLLHRRRRAVRVRRVDH